MAEQLPAGTADPQAGAPPQSVGFSIERIYIKDLSLESPGAPQSFQMTEPPQVEIGLRSKGDYLGNDLYEFLLTLTVTATAAGKTVFLVEVAQGGVFMIRGLPQEQIQPVLAIHCPTVLFPYAREAIADATMRAGFPPVHLAPVNFEALYQQQMAQGQQPVPAVTN
jgi:preprotein translocase subunit SecB